MLHPSYNDLMNVANSDVEPGEHPVVNSRYSIVLATAKRARQLIDGSVPLVDGKYPKPLVWRLRSCLHLPSKLIQKRMKQKMN